MGTAPTQCPWMGWDWDTPLLGARSLLGWWQGCSCPRAARTAGLTHTRSSRSLSAFFFQTEGGIPCLSCTATPDPERGRADGGTLPPASPCTAPCHRDGQGSGCSPLGSLCRGRQNKQSLPFSGAFQPRLIRQKRHSWQDSGGMGGAALLLHCSGLCIGSALPRSTSRVSLPPQNGCRCSWCIPGQGRAHSLAAIHQCLTRGFIFQAAKSPSSNPDTLIGLESRAKPVGSHPLGLSRALQAGSTELCPRAGL